MRGFRRLAAGRAIILREGPLALNGTMIRRSDSCSVSFAERDPESSSGEFTPSLFRAAKKKEGGGVRGGAGEGRVVTIAIDGIYPFSITKK